METLQRRQTRAPQKIGVFSLSSLSPYFQLTNTRRVGNLGRIKILILIKIMKAFVRGGVYTNYGDSRFDYNSEFFDGSGQNGGNFEINIPLSSVVTYDESGIRNYLETAILAEAVNRSYSGFTADDILWDASAVLPSSVSDGLSGYVSATIDGKSVGNTTVFTNTSAKDFWLEMYAVMPQTITGLGTAPVINVGKTASNYNDIDSGLSLAFAANAGKASWKTPGNNFVKVAAGESLVVRVSVAAILTTAYTFKVAAKGMYI